ALREVGAEVAGDPELRARQARGAVIALVHFVRVVELAVVPFRVAGVKAGVARVYGRLAVEVALAEHRATARLDDRGVHRPGGGGRLHRIGTEEEEGGESDEEDNEERAGPGHTRLLGWRRCGRRTIARQCAAANSTGRGP